MIQFEMLQCGERAWSTKWPAFAQVSYNDKLTTLIFQFPKHFPVLLFLTYFRATNHSFFRQLVFSGWEAHSSTTALPDLTPKPFFNALSLCPLRVAGLIS